MRIKTALLFILFSLSTYSQNVINLEKTQTFFPDWKELKNENIDCYYLSVPENYDRPEGKKIKLAVSVIHSTSGIDNNPVVFIQGGPGGSTISGLWRWLGHPLRKTGDIILIDLRGTGFSDSMCPDLGKKFFEILSKNQSIKKDERDKVKLSLECQQDLIDRGIDIESYNSVSVSKDLNNLKNALKITKWNVYGVSYGTFLSQEYAKHFPDDIKSLILDSSISNIGKYYDNLNSNYVSSLDKLFQECKNNPECNKKFPNLSEVYFSVIKELEQNPITVKVDKEKLQSGQFTYNSEDFKIAIHQSLYQKKMIEVLPLLIYQFHERNKTALSALAGVFSGALALDYGTYYCYTCNEVVPNNSIAEFKKNAGLNVKMRGGLSFYQSDYEVCNLWNVKAKVLKKASNYLKNNKFKVLIFSGGFDPITPSLFAVETANNYNDSQIVFAKTSGHASSFSIEGNEILYNFIKKPKIDPISLFKSEPISFRADILVKNGVYNLANDLNGFDWLFFSPLFVAFFILVSFIFHFFIQIKSNKSRKLNISLFITVLTIVSAIVILITIIYQISNINFYILAFGVPVEFSYVFFIVKASLFFTLLSLCFFIRYFATLKNTQYYTLVIFSLLIVNVYLYYWGILI